MTKIEELEQKLNEASSGFEFVINEIRKELVFYKTQKELKESKKECKWKPTYGDYYWFRTSCGDVSGDDWTNDKYDDWRINNIPIFPTKEACERYWRFMDTVKEKSYEFTGLNWGNDDFIKYSISYDFKLDEFNINETSVVKYFGEVYFKTKTDAQYIIDNFKEELMEFFV